MWLVRIFTFFFLICPSKGVTYGLLASVLSSSKEFVGGHALRKTTKLFSDGAMRH